MSHCDGMNKQITHTPRLPLSALVDAPVMPVALHELCLLRHVLANTAVLLQGIYCSSCSSRNKAQTGRSTLKRVEERQRERNAIFIFCIRFRLCQLSHKQGTGRRTIRQTDRRTDRQRQKGRGGGGESATHCVCAALSVCHANRTRCVPRQSQ